MIIVGCAGFAVPATRYFKEYGFVEIHETHRSAPGPGTVRRWRREAPEDFEFAVLGPREVTQEAFRPGKVIETALAGLGEVAAELDARTAVFVAAPEFAQNRPNKAALKEFLGLARERFKNVIFEPGVDWNPDDADAIADETGTVAARDPLQHGPSKRPVAYYRLPGPAGHKSRYEDPAIERLAEIAHGAHHESVHYVFTNVDMFADAKRFKKAYGL